MDAYGTVAVNIILWKFKERRFYKNLPILVEPENASEWVPVVTVFSKNEMKEIMDDKIFLL